MFLGFGSSNAGTPAAAPRRPLAFLARRIARSHWISVVLLNDAVLRDLVRLLASEPDTPVFRSRKGGGRLDASTVHRIVVGAARRVGLPGTVSAGSLRYAHMSHAFSRGTALLAGNATLYDRTHFLA